MSFAVCFLGFSVIFAVGWLAIQSGAGAAQAVQAAGATKGCLLFIAAVILLTMIAMMLG